MTEVELQKVLHSFQKDKSLGPNGWSVEFFMGLYDIFGGNLLRVVEDSWQYSRMLDSFKYTCISLIPKLDTPQSFDYFRSISLCNCIDKVIRKS